MQNILSTVAHRPYPLPTGKWRMAQRWNDLLFAHWPIPPNEIARLLPAGLEVDTFDHRAWIGVVPFWMDQVRTRTFGDRAITIPSTGSFCELNLRTYVRSPRTGLHGVFFFSLDAASALAVAGARTLFHLPYYLARMHRTTEPSGISPTIHYTSRRLFPTPGPRFEATYQGSGKLSAPSLPGSLEHFLTERYCLFTPHAGRILTGHIHHLPWPLEPAEADIRINHLPAAHGITLPKTTPILHFARQLEVAIWPLRTDSTGR